MEKLNINSMNFTQNDLYNFYFDVINSDIIKKYHIANKDSQKRNICKQIILSYFEGFDNKKINDLSQQLNLLLSGNKMNLFVVSIESGISFNMWQKYA